MDYSIGHGHFLVYCILVAFMLDLVLHTNDKNGKKSNVNIEYFKIYKKKIVL